MSCGVKRDPRKVIWSPGNACIGDTSVTHGRVSEFVPGVLREFEELARHRRCPSENHRHPSNPADRSPRVTVLGVLARFADAGAPTGATGAACTTRATTARAPAGILDLEGTVGDGGRQRVFEHADGDLAAIAATAAAATRVRHCRRRRHRRRRPDRACNASRRPRCARRPRRRHRDRRVRRAGRDRRCARLRR